MRINRKHLSIILALSMVLTLPCSAYGTEDDAFDVSENEISLEPEVDVSAMDGERAAEDELLVLIEEDTSKKEIKNITEDAGASLDTISTLEDGKKLASVSLDDPRDAQDVADSLITEGKVLIVQPNYLYKISEEESGDSGNELFQWHLSSDSDRYPGSTQAFKAWKELSDSTDKVKLAVIDTGVKLNHSDLTDAILEDECVAVCDGEIQDFKYKDKSDDDDGHGTHVCGIIAAKAGDNSGVSGMSNNRAQLIVIDAENYNPGIDDDCFTTEDLIKAIDYAVDKQAKIINMSLGGIEEDPILEDRVNWATYDKGVLCVCAAGNESSELPETPGDASAAISVIAHNQKGNRASFSNYGIEKDVSAPGVGIMSTYINKKNPADSTYYQESGTSMASPVVAGLAALIKSEDKGLNSREIKNYIFTSSGTQRFGETAGFGRINAYNAVMNVKASKASPVNPSKVVLNKTSINMHVGESSAIEYAVYPASASKYADEVIFTSSDESVVIVDKHGCVEANKAGRATITARCKGITATCSVLVKEPPYATVNKLPYRADGVFAPDDYKTKFTHDEGTYSAYTDIYELKAPKTDRELIIRVTCREAIPYIRVFDSSGKEVKTNLRFNTPSDDWGKETTYVVTASYKPIAHENYRIEALGINYGSTVINKKYTIKIDGFTDISETLVSNISDKTYTGSKIYQKPTLKYNGYTLIEGEDYWLSYSNNKRIGVAGVTIKGLGAYEGSITKNFKILPKGTKLGKLKKGRKSVTVKWKKRSSKMPIARIKGYQLQLSTDSKFKKNVKSIKVKGYKKTSKKISKLKKKTKYYVRIRTYYKTGGATYYSKWSKVKRIKTR